MGPELNIAAESHNVVSMNKLNNNNWNVWKFQIKVILMAKDLYDIVNGTDKQPIEGAELIAKWKLRDAKAQEALVTRMEEGPLAHIMQCPFACEMWKKLESIYDRQSVVSKHLLNEQFYNVKFDGDLNSFITKVTNICAKIKQQSDEVPERMVMTKILMSLPESCEKKEHIKNQCKKNMECFYCKKKGHLMKDCFHKKQKERGENKQQKKTCSTSSNFALVTVSSDIESQGNTENSTFCSSCVQGKQHREPFPASETRAKEVCALIHIDLCGPMEVLSIRGSKYMLLLKDDHSKYRTVYFIKHKSEVYDKLNEFIVYAKTQTGKCIKVMRSDNGTEFTNQTVCDLFKRHGIQHQLTVVYAPQQNGRAEREFYQFVTCLNDMGYNIS
ncbi:Integrase core domain [Popillia japonica]|uniref:Integrase core domain n=1 Tax=Popillia japonica TaxID=7064 RepID=A0AAW1I728_POPJA